jgi:L-alanine-DL-glutamate epimerase-like enolase superfamily enzyme
MKITDIRTYPVWGGSRNYLFVVVETDEGLTGVGEAGITSRELAVIGAIEHFKPLLLGQDANRIEYLWQLLHRGGFFPGGKIICAALSAIDIALWDIQGKARGVPVYQLLGGLARDKVVCYPHNTGATTEALVESCLLTTAEGWKFVRWGIQAEGDVMENGPAVRLALQQFEAVRKALGNEIEICFDVHTRLDPPAAIQLCRAVEPYRPFFIEDPLRSESPYSLRLVRQQTGVPIAVGEQFATKFEFRQVIEEELTDYARIDLCIVGGITEAKKIAGWCEAHYIQLALHNPLGPVSSAACLHLNLASPNVGVMEQPRRPGTVLTDVVPVQMTWEDGYLLPPTAPGLGVVFDEEAAKRHPFQMQELPHYRRRDGSFTNW